MRANHTPTALPGALRSRAEAFFGADFSGVQLEVGAAPDLLGAAAFARGDTIHLAPWAERLPAPQLEELLGHELAHVIQQRQGRAAPRRQVGGIDVDDDEALEAEAAELGRRFAAGDGDRPPPAGAERQGGPPVAQRAVSVAGTMVQLPAALSERARLSLVFIDGGMEWLAWAIANTQVRYDFPDETQLLAGVQSGLHASPLTLLPAIGLLVSPVKLMTMRASDLRTLASAERGDTSSVVAHQTNKILAEHALLTQRDLAAGASFLREVGVADAAVLQAMGLDAQLAIYDLISASEGEIAQRLDLQKEAAAFGARHGRTPAEFVDFYKAYLIQSAKTDALGGTEAQRDAVAEAAVQTLQTCLFGALDGPQITGLASPAEVARAVSTWLMMGKQVGFARVSAGVQQIIQHTQYQRETGDAARAVVGGYLKEAQAFLSANEPLGGKMGQDGATCVFNIEGETTQGQLELSPGGIITLRSFRLKAGPPPPPSSPPPAPAPAATPGEDGQGGDA